MMKFIRWYVFCLAIFLRTVRSVHIEQKYNKEPCGPYGFRCLNDKLFEICAEFRQTDDPSFEGAARLYPPIGSQATCGVGRECDKENPLYCTSDSVIRDRRFHGGSKQVEHHSSPDREGRNEHPNKKHAKDNDHLSPERWRNRRNKHTKSDQHQKVATASITATKERGTGISKLDAANKDVSMEGKTGETRGIADAKIEQGSENETSQTKKGKRNKTKETKRERENDTSDAKNENEIDLELPKIEKEKDNGISEIKNEKADEKVEEKESCDAENVTGEPLGNGIETSGKEKGEEEECAGAEKPESVETAMQKGKSPPVIFNESKPHSKHVGTSGNGKGGTYEINSQGSSSNHQTSKPCGSNQETQPTTCAPPSRPPTEKSTPASTCEPSPSTTECSRDTEPPPAQAPAAQPPSDSNDSNFQPFVFDESSTQGAESAEADIYHGYQAGIPHSCSNKCDHYSSSQSGGIKRSGSHARTAGLEKTGASSSKSIVVKRGTELTKTVDTKRSGCPSKCVVLMPPSSGCGHSQAKVSCGVPESTSKSCGSCEEATTESCGCNEPQSTPESCGCEESTTESCGCEESTTESCGCEESTTESCGCKESTTESCGCEESTPESCGCKESTTESCGCEESTTESCGCEKSTTESCGCKESTTESCGCEESTTESCGCEEPTTESCGCEKSTTESCGCDKRSPQNHPFPESSGSRDRAGKFDLSGTHKESSELEKKTELSPASIVNKRDTEAELTNKDAKKRSGCPSKCVVIMSSASGSCKDDNQSRQRPQVSCGAPVTTDAPCGSCDGSTTKSCGCREATNEPGECGKPSPQNQPVPKPCGSSGRAGTFSLSGSEKESAELEKKDELSPASIVDKRDTEAELTNKVSKKRSGGPSKSVAIMSPLSGSSDDYDQSNQGPQVSWGAPVGCNKPKPTLGNCGCNAPQSCGCDEPKPTPASCGCDEPKPTHASCGCDEPKPTPASCGCDEPEPTPASCGCDEPKPTHASCGCDEPKPTHASCGCDEPEPTPASCGCDEPKPPPVPCGCNQPEEPPPMPCHTCSDQESALVYDESEYIDESQNQCSCDKPGASCPVHQAIHEPKNHHFNCNGEGKFADPDNGKTFYVCHPKRTDNGFHELRMSCPIGELFDPAKQRCVPTSPLDEVYDEDFNTESQY